jgi:hypothetical protein
LADLASEGVEELDGIGADDGMYAAGRCLQIGHDVLGEEGDQVDEGVGGSDAGSGGADAAGCDRREQEDGGILGFPLIRRIGVVLLLGVGDIAHLAH